MAETPKRKLFQTPQKAKQSSLNPSLSAFPISPQTPSPFRRSSRLLLTSPQKQAETARNETVQESRGLEKIGLKTPKRSSAPSGDRSVQKRSCNEGDAKTPKKNTNDGKSNSKLNLTKSDNVDAPFAVVSPDRSETKSRRGNKKTVIQTRAAKASRNVDSCTKTKKRVYMRKVEFDGSEFVVGDDVYVKRRDEAGSDAEDPQVEECRICFKSGDNVMIECDECLGGFHLKCLKPPLKVVPEDDWICQFCNAKRSGKKVLLPKPPKGKKLMRTLREKLLTSDLWATRIESMWKEVDGEYWFRARWYVIPEETATGRQQHNLKRELYRTNDFADVEMESILRHCYVMNPRDYAKAANDGDDVFLCEYEYDVTWHTFKRLDDIDSDEEGGDDDKDWTTGVVADSESDEDIDYEDEDEDEDKRTSQKKWSACRTVDVNFRKGKSFNLQKIGIKRIPDHVRCRKQTDIEKAKATLLLAALPKTLPCRNKEMEEISGFIRGAINDDQCLGRCLYIHGVPGTGKTMSVLAVLRNIKSEVDAGSIRPYSFVEVNGLKLASPENIYRVIYEALSGYRVGWKKALNLLNERFSGGKRSGKEDDRPCILLIDELDLLVTRNQSVLYNILDWPTKPNSKLVVIGIANTMDLPEKLLPRISSRMGIQRLCFGPYNYQQLQEIISTRLNGINAFEKQAIEFASRKVAAISGDARRALEICRRAAEIADYRVKNSNSTGGKTLTCMADVDAAIQEMFQAPHIQIMKSGSKLDKIYLTAMVYELYRTGMAETTFEKLAMTVSSICTSNGEDYPGWDTLLRIGCKLGESRIIICEAGSKHRMQKLLLNYPSDDVAFALKNTKELPWLAKYL